MPKANPSPAGRVFAKTAAVWPSLRIQAKAMVPAKAPLWLWEAESTIQPLA